MLIQRRPCESESKFFINFSIHSQAWAPGGSNDRMARGLWYQKIQANSQSLMRFNRVGSELFISLHTQLIVLGCALAFQSLFHLGSFREFGFLMSLYPCLARRAELNASKFLNPTPPSILLVHNLSHLIQ
nr:uncharacterized protein LOC112801415 isoform X1 [Arachis hypogaea]